jgi:hypothetical protein
MQCDKGAEEMHDAEGGGDDRQREQRVAPEERQLRRGARELQQVVEREDDPDLDAEPVQARHLRGR